MEKFIFTFSREHLYDGFYQPIYAKDFLTARKKMLEVHGMEWFGQFYENEWDKVKKERHRIEHELTPIYAEGGD